LIKSELNYTRYVVFPARVASHKNYNVALLLYSQQQPNL